MKEGHKPLIAFTVGDINGVGPELILKAFSNKKVLQICTPVIYGSSKLFSFYKKELKIHEFNYKQIEDISDADNRKVNLINCWQDDIKITPGESTQDGGKASFLSLKLAAKDWSDGKVDALVTAPINKNNIQREDFKFPGHTEYLTELSGEKDSLMLMTSPSLKLGVATGHIPLSDVSKSLNTVGIVNKGAILNKILKSDFGIQRPKIAILGVNPHAGDGGLLGKEDDEVVFPAINKLKEKNILAFGPFSADGFFGTSNFKSYDGILAMYHDQGLIPFKTIAFEEGVNFTAGLKLVRTSPDHGTAYEIAGKGKVNISSFLNAIYTAIDVLKNRKEFA